MSRPNMAELKRSGQRYRRGLRDQAEALADLGRALDNGWHHDLGMSPIQLAKEAGYPGGGRSLQHLTLSSRLLAWDSRWVTALVAAEISMTHVREAAAWLLEFRNKRMSLKALEAAKSLSSAAFKQWVCLAKNGIDDVDFDTIEVPRCYVMHIPVVQEVKDQWSAWRVLLEDGEGRAVSNSEVLAKALAAAIAAARSGGKRRRTVEAT